MTLGALTSFFASCEFYSVPQLDLLSLQAMENPTHLGVRTRRRFAWIVDSSMAWSSPTLFSVSFILKQNGSWWVEPYALLNLYPAEKVHFLFPQDSHKSIGPDFSVGWIKSPIPSLEPGQCQVLMAKAWVTGPPRACSGRVEKEVTPGWKIRKLLPT